MIIGYPRRLTKPVSHNEESQEPHSLVDMPQEHEHWPVTVLGLKDNVPCTDEVPHRHELPPPQQFGLFGPQQLAPVPNRSNKAPPVLPQQELAEKGAGLDPQQPLEDVGPDVEGRPQQPPEEDIGTEAVVEGWPQQD